MKIYLLLFGSLILMQCNSGADTSIPSNCYSNLISCYPFPVSSITRSQCEATEGCQYFPVEPDPRMKCLRVGCPAGTELRYDNRSCCHVPALSRVVGGKLSKLGQWPWLVYILIQNDYGEPPFMCAGVLIDASHILSAGHCYRRSAYYYVWGGRTVAEWAKNPIFFYGDENYVKLHPRFRQTGEIYEHDLMLITIPTISHFTENFHPINLPKGETTPVGMRCFVAGWGGTTYDGGNFTAELHEVGLDIISHMLCRTNFSPLLAETHHLCAEDYHGNDNDTICSGDDGSPLVCQRCNSCEWYVAGITSFGGKCKGHRYSVFTRLRTYEQQWLDDVGVKLVNDYDCHQYDDLNSEPFFYFGDTPEDW